MKVILVIGACGSGKTWVMKQLIKKMKLDVLGKVGMFYFHRNDKTVVLGKYDGTTFEGSDKLSMAVMADVKKFVLWCKDRDVVVCEGDRFMNKTFADALKNNLNVLHIVDDGTKGRALRKSAQTERQIKSIQTRVNNFASRAKWQCRNSKEALRIIMEQV